MSSTKPSARGGRHGGFRGGGKTALPPSLQQSISGYASFSAIQNVLGDAISIRKSSKPLFPDFSLPIPTPVSTRMKKLLSIKAQLDSFYSASAYYVAERRTPKKVARYSDKYDKVNLDGLSIHDIHIADVSRIPEELLGVYTPDKHRQRKSLKNTINPSQLFKFLKLDDLEKEEATKIEDNDEQDQQMEEEELVDEFEEEEFDENDYNASYFDPGDDFGADFDDGDEGPIY